MFPQEYAEQFYYVKGIAALCATVALIVHMLRKWSRIDSLGQRLRYLTLLYFAAIITFASVDQVKGHSLIDGRSVAGIGGAFLLIVAMAVSIREDSRKSR